jgi:uncharacterized membrane protein YphA (DoxX/SURF4 family)
MKNTFSIPGMTVIRIGCGMFFIVTGFSKLLFAVTWAYGIPATIASLLFIDPTTLVHFAGATEIVFGAAVVCGLFTRLAAFILLTLHMLITVFIDASISPTSFALLLVIGALFLNGSDEYSIDSAYLVPVQSASAPTNPVFLLSNRNVYLFAAISMLFLVIIGYVSVFIRTTPVLNAAFAHVLEPKVEQKILVEKPVTPIATVSPTIPVKPTPTPAPVKQPSVPTKPKAPAGITMAQVAAHNSSASCYTVVNGNVYDVTAWISEHPGGSGAIKGMCGIDATDTFTGKHGGQARPESELAKFKIGAVQ